MSDVQVPEHIQKFVLENTKTMDSLVSSLCGEPYLSEWCCQNENEQRDDNDLISDCSLSNDATFQNLHPCGYQFQSETQEELLHTSPYAHDVNNNNQPMYSYSPEQCYTPNNYIMHTSQNLPINCIKQDPYTIQPQFYEFQHLRGTYRDSIQDTQYDSDESVEISSDIVANSSFQSIHIKTEKTMNNRLPAFNEFFGRPRHNSRTNRGRPVTYNRPGSNFVDSDELDSEEDDQYSTKMGTSKVRRGAKNILLWKFLLEELVSKKATHVQWVNRMEGTFKFVDTAECSKLWGLKKKKEDMNFEKLSRGIRHYYRDGLMSRLDGTRLVYKFNWDRVPKAFRKMASV